MPYPDITTISADLVSDLFPSATGDHLADLLATSLSIAESFVEGSPVYVTSADIRQHVRYRLQEGGCQEGTAEIIARTRMLRDLCYQWAFGEDADDLLPFDVDLVVDIAISEARLQMEENRWPPGDESRARLRWLLDKAIAQRRRAIKAG